MVDSLGTHRNPVKYSGFFARLRQFRLHSAQNRLRQA